MSRSVRKHPFIGMTGAESEKFNKQLVNRKFRAEVRRALVDYDDSIPLPAIREVSEVYTFAKDGKQHLSAEYQTYKLMGK